MADPPAQANEALQALRSVTPARLGLGQAGQGLPTAPMLAFQMAHAKAQDAVHALLDVDFLQSEISLPTLVVESAASSRAEYLRRPDLGRRLGLNNLQDYRGHYDLALVLADGLSATAAHAHGPALIQALAAQLSDWTLAPVVIARFARVAIGDPIGEALGARMVVIVLGERPGLSAADSLSAYITYGPKPGRQDSERNCVSNIRTPDGLSPPRAAETIVWLLREAGRLGLTGVALKDRRGHGQVDNTAEEAVQSPALLADHGS